MKELSIEQKAKAYDEVVKRAKIEKEKSRNLGLLEFIDENFPELKESEDERIRKELISFFTERAKYTEDSTFNGLSSKEIIAWLEKQANQKPLNKIKIGKEYKCIASPRYSAFIRGNIYKPEDEFICSLMNFCSDCFEPIKDEQKPTNWLQELEDKLANATPKQLAEWKEKYFKEEIFWSEEDEKMLNDIIMCGEHHCYLDAGNIAWLKSIKDRVQPQNSNITDEEPCASKDAYNDSELLLVRSLPGVHFREDNHNYITIREDTLMQVIEEIIKGEKISFI